MSKWFYYSCPDGHGGQMTDRKYPESWMLSWLRPKCSKCGKRYIETPEGIQLAFAAIKAGGT